MTTQLKAVRVLTGIVRRAAEADLPRLTWTVEPYDGAGLRAQPWGGGEVTSVAVIAAWAGHLGVEPVTSRHKKFTKVEVTAEVDGVRVQIFTLTGETHTWVSVPREQAEGAK